MIRQNMMDAGVLWGLFFFHFEVLRVNLFDAKPKVDTSPGLVF